MRLATLLFLAACGVPAITPPPLAETASVPASEVVRLYSSNPTAGDERYNDAWLVLSSVRVDQIEGTKVRQAGEVELVLSFSEKDDILKLGRGNRITAQCEGDGIRSGRVRFEYCRLLQRN